MGLNVQFGSCNYTAVVYSLQNRMGLSGYQKEQNLISVDSAYVDRVSTAAKARAVEYEADEPLSDTQLDQLYSIYLQLGDEDEFYGRIGSLVQEMAGADRDNFLSALSRAGDELKPVVLMTEALAGTDRSGFLETAARIAPGDALSGLIEAVSKTDRESRAGFFEVADQLNRSAESINARELENFVLAAAGSPVDIPALTAKTLEYGENEVNRANFLAAAAGSGQNLSQLIGVADSLENKDLFDFLASAARAGQGLSNLMQLSSALGGDERSEWLSFLTDLEDQNLDNFLLATHGEKANLSRLTAVTNELSGQNRTHFLEVAANVAGSLSPLLGVVQKLEAPSGDLENFLSAGMKAGDGFSDFVGIVQDLSGSIRRETLSFAAGLSLSDLGSFIQAAKENNASDLVSTGNDLAGKDKSYFLYAASVTGDVQGLAAQLEDLNENEKSDFLFMAANMDSAPGAEWENYLDDLGQMEEPEREGYLSSERMLTLAAKGTDATYVYLNSVFDEEAMAALLGADSNPDNLLGAIDELDTGQRQAFLAAAGKAGPETVQDLMMVAERLDNSDAQAFRALAQTLKPKNLVNFINAAKTALDGSDSGKTRLNRLMDVTRDLPAPVREDFLNAAARAGRSLDGFLDLTGQLGGELRVDFLIAADRIADSPGGGQWLSLYIQGTSNMIERNQNEFFNGAVKLGRQSGAVLLEKSISGTSTYSVATYLRSAAWVTGPGIDNTLKQQWIASFV